MSIKPADSREILEQFIEQNAVKIKESPEQFIDELRNIVKNIPARRNDSLLRYNLAPGDRALLLQASCVEEMRALKRALSEFNYATYEGSAVYEKARAVEPAFFFPRIFCVEILPQTGYRPSSENYLARILGELPTVDYFPMLCPKDAIFVSEEDLSELKAIYKKNIADTEAWLDEMELVKRHELDRKFTRIRDNLKQETLDSQKALNDYGLHEPLETSTHTEEITISAEDDAKVPWNEGNPA